MAKKKTEHEIDDELDDKDLENQDADDENDEDDEGEEEGKDSGKEGSEGADDSSVEEEDDEDDPDSAKKKEADAEREAIRERRRREKKMKRERDKRERMQMQNTIIMMADEIKKLKDGHGEVNKKFEGLTSQQIDGEISELSKIYNQAQAAMEAAVAEGDGKKFTQAKAISDKAWARYTFLETQKHQRPKTTQDDKQDRSDHGSSRRESESADDASEGVQLGKDGKRYGIAFVNKHKSWYDPNGGNKDSKRVIRIDAELYEEGFDPETKEYWDELEDRCREELPHRFKGSGNKPRPKSIVGGSGNDHSPAGSAEKSLPKEFVQTLKAAGYWDDPVKRKAAIKNYYANKRGA